MLSVGSSSASVASLGAAIGPSAQPRSGAPAREIVVQRGEWLYDICRRHRVNFKAILRANPGLRNPELLPIGSTLRLPDNEPFLFPPPPPPSAAAAAAASSSGGAIGIMRRDRSPTRLGSADLASLSSTLTSAAAGPSTGAAASLMGGGRGAHAPHIHRGAASSPAPPTRAPAPPHHPRSGSSSGGGGRASPPLLRTAPGVKARHGLFKRRKKPPPLPLPQPPRQASSSASAMRAPPAGNLAAKRLGKGGGPALAEAVWNLIHAGLTALAISKPSNSSGGSGGSISGDSGGGSQRRGVKRASAASRRERQACMDGSGGAGLPPPCQLSKDFQCRGRISGGGCGSSSPSSSSGTVPRSAPLPPVPAGGKRVLVRDGQRLCDIADEHKVTIRDVQRANNLRSDNIYTGELLVIPPGPVKAEGSFFLRPGMRRTARLLFSRWPSSPQGLSHAPGGSGRSSRAPGRASHPPRLPTPTPGVALKGRKPRDQGHLQRGAKGFPRHLRTFVSSPFGPRSMNGRPEEPHEGVDVAAEPGTPIFAADGGTVIYAEPNANSVLFLSCPGPAVPCAKSCHVVSASVLLCFLRYGNLLIIRHSGSYTTRYAHCQSIYARCGQCAKTMSLWTPSFGPHCDGYGRH
eukprot:jgi/Mesen1/1022/ME000121S00102